MEEANKYLTVVEVAEILGTSTKTIYRYIKEKRLRAAKIGRSWKIRKGDLTAFVEDCFGD